MRVRVVFVGGEQGPTTTRPGGLSRAAQVASGDPGQARQVEVDGLRSRRATGARLPHAQLPVKEPDMTSLRNDPARVVDAGAAWRLIARCDPAHPEHRPEIGKAVAVAQHHAARGHDTEMRRAGVEAVQVSLLIDRGLLDTALPQDIDDARRDAEDLMGLHPYGRVPDRDPVLELGVIVITAALRASLDPDDYAGIGTFIARHQRGDWGDLDNPVDTAANVAANDWALAEGDQIISTYRLPGGQDVWVIAEWDRSATTVLRPSDR
jgi:hypothetical protein